LKFQVVDAMWSMYAQHRKGAWRKAAAWGYAIFAYRDMLDNKSPETVTL
jgi:hypothetical protein